MKTFVQKEKERNMQEFKKFVMLQDGCYETPRYYLEEDMIIGFSNEALTYKIPEKIAKEIWGESPEKEIAKTCNDYDLIEKMEEEREDISFEEWELKDIEYFISSASEPCYYHQYGFDEAELYDSEEDFFSQYPDRNIIYGIPDNGYAPRWVSESLDTIYLKFIELVKEIDTDEYCDINGEYCYAVYIEKWENEKGESVLLEHRVHDAETYNVIQ
ncbi:MAG TPA: hypothetical protein ENN12_01805 [Epsilonproteobacteria bacterium]|nr:hypothetical protein [Campylobacterota bacterium]